ncbi:hypothetical protein APS_1444 [Acetobacter pasteurianus subsp. pasteurianus LMG 1262 = NBRC 106471]|nr:hypothetical protein APS_1444 [Acetobacter pasteurianus subsp. pasteurianus LMG 1262 = NBRC 106471]
MTAQYKLQGQIYGPARVALRWLGLSAKFYENLQAKCPCGK